MKCSAYQYNTSCQRRNSDQASSVCKNMAALLLAKRVSINISKTSPKDSPNGFQSASRISATQCLSTAYEHAEGSKAVAEAESTDSRTGSGASRDSLYEEKQEASLDVDEGRASGMTGHVAEKLEDGPRKALDTAKQTMDCAWKVAKETTEKMKDNVIGYHEDHIHKDPAVFEAKNVDDPIDTQEYRGFEEMRIKADGDDEAAH